ETRGDALVEDALRIGEAAGERIRRDDAGADLIRDEDDRRRDGGERGEEAFGLRLRVAPGLHEIGEPEGQAIHEHGARLTGPAKRGGKLERRLDGRPGIAAPGAMRGDARRHLGIAVVSIAVSWGR